MTDIEIPKASIRPWLTLFLLGSAYFFLMLHRQILTVLVDPIKMDLGISDTQFGLIQGFAFAVFYMSFGIPIAMLADRWNRKLIIACGVFLWSLSTACGGFARSFGWLFTARTGVGLGEASLAPAAYSLFADLFGPKRIGRVLGIFQVFPGVGMSLSVAIGGILYQYFSSRGEINFLGSKVPAWGMTLIAVGVPGIVLAAIILAFVYEPRREAASGRANRATTAPSGRRALIPTLFERHGYFLRLLGGSSMLSIASSAVLTWSAAYLIRVFKLSTAEAGVRFGLALAIGGICGPLIAGVLADWLQKNWKSRAPLLVQTGFNIVVLLSSVGFLFAGNADVAVVILVLCSTVFSGMHPLFASAIQLGVHSSVRAQVSAVWLCLNSLIGLGLGALLVGVLNDRVFGSPSSVGLSMGIVIISALVPGTLLIASLLRTKEEAATIFSEARSLRS